MASCIPTSYHLDQSSWAPLNCDSEHTWLQGTFLAAVAYGIEVVLFSMVFYYLWKQRCAANRRRLILIFYSSIMFALSTLYIAVLLQYTQTTLTGQGDQAPGYDDSAVENTLTSTPVGDVVYFIMAIQGWICDVTNLWRSYVVYQGCRFPSWLINMIPALLYMASLGIGVSYLIHTLSTKGPLVFFFVLSFLVVSICFKIVVTLLLVFRIMAFRRKIIQLLGKHHGSEYASFTAAIIESAALQTTFSLLFIATTSSNSGKMLPVNQIFLLTLSPIQGISTFLIILRVARGKAWKKETYESAIQNLSTLRFTGGTDGGLWQQDAEECCIRTVEQRVV